MQRFVRVHAFGYAGRSVAEDALDCCIIGTGIVEHCGACMAALVGRMVAISRIHDVIKARPKTMIGQCSAIIYRDEGFARLIHPQLKIGQRLAADWYSPVTASFGLAVAYDVIALF